MNFSHRFESISFHSSTNKKSTNSRLGAAFIFVARIGSARFLSTDAGYGGLGSAFFMSERQHGPYDNIAGRWLALVERRQQNLIDLCKSGRWRHYYTHAQFLDEMRKVLHLRNQWAELAGLPHSGQTELRQIDLQQTVSQQTRSQQEDANSKQNDQANRNAQPQARPSWHRAGERWRLPASAILAAVTGRL